jgi:hypothetical protein
MPSNALSSRRSHPVRPHICHPPPPPPLPPPPPAVWCSIDPIYAEIPGDMSLWFDLEACMESGAALGILCYLTADGGHWDTSPVPISDCGGPTAALYISASSEGEYELTAHFVSSPLGLECTKHATVKVIPMM